jgi:hypothetical protein
VADERDAARKQHEDLVAAFALDGEALAENRAGRLTLRQRLGLFGQTLPALLGAAFCVGVLVLIYVGFNVSPFSKTGGRVLLLLLAVVDVVSGFLYLWEVLLGLSDAVAGLAATVEGPVTRSSLHRSRGENEYYLHCEGLRLRVPKPAWDALKAEGIVHRVHYSRASRWAVAVEVASIADEARDP